MFSKIYIVILILFINFKEYNSLVALSSSTHIPPNQKVLCDIVNKLFSDFRLVKNNKLLDFSTVNNFLTSVSLEHYNTLSEIVKLTRVNINIKQTNFIDIINQILDEDDKDTQEHYKIYANDDKVVEYIDKFVNDLENWKDSMDLYDNYSDINKEVLQYLKDDSIMSNSSMEASNSNESEIFNNNEFWQLGGRRIYRGRRTKIKQFPFMASIHIFQSFHCGGSIINPDLVITAASCLQLAWNNRFFRENPAFLSVRVGSNFHKGGGESIPVIEVYFHPEYNPNNLHNNICLLRLNRRLNFKRSRKKVKRIKIDRNPWRLPEDTDGVTVVGWGARASSNIVENPWRNRLSYSVLDIYPLRECRELYSRKYVTGKHFCAGFFSKGGGACNRDVGGPGIVNGILAGVISFGSPICGATDSPTVFTKLGHYYDWIEEIMEHDVPNTHKRTTLQPSTDRVSVASATMPIKTTFKVTPLTDVKTPVPISEADTLRTSKERALFKEFLATIFEKKEKNHDTNDMINIRQAKNANAKQDKSLTQHYVEYVTKINYGESVEMVTEHNVRHTVISANEDVQSELEKDIVKLIENIDVNDVDNYIDNTPIEEIHNDDKNGVEEVNSNNLRKSEEEVKKPINPIINLLYFSDNEMKNEASDDADSAHGGLSIPAHSFKDMTYRNNDTDILDLLSKDELYALLADALRETQDIDDDI